MQDIDISLKKSAYNDVLPVTGIQAINQSLEILFGVFTKTLRTRPRWGTKLYSLLGEKMNNMLKIQIKDMVRYEIENFIPFITVLEVNVDYEGSSNFINIEVRYVENSTGDIGNYTILFEREG